MTGLTERDVAERRIFFSCLWTGLNLWNGHLMKIKVFMNGMPPSMDITWP